MQYIAFDSHKKYTFVSIAKSDGGILKEGRIDHARGAIKKFLSSLETGSSVAVETIGNWYWIIDEIEAAGMVPKLVHARRAKVMMGMTNKTDKLDARGLNRLQQAGTLPTVWISPGDLRDKRELTRTRMMFSKQRTQIKNRIHANLAKYAVQIPEVKDIFGVTGRGLLDERIKRLPLYTQETTQHMLDELDFVEKKISGFDQQIKKTFQDTPELKLIRTLPGVSWVLGIVIFLENGDNGRFPSAQQYASYSGSTPRVQSSGGKTRMGQLRCDVNRYLKWAYVEAANAVCTHRATYPDRHVTQLYNRIQRHKGHAKAIGAVARHLAEATHSILKHKKAYHEPTVRPVSSRNDMREVCLSLDARGVIATSF